MRVLIIEGSALIRKLTVLALPAGEYELHEAADGREALAMIGRAAQPFDAIVLDLEMPDMSGVEFLRFLRRLALHGDTPVVAATGEADDAAVVREISMANVAAIVKKPWKPHELGRLVRSCDLTVAGRDALERDRRLGARG